MEITHFVTSRREALLISDANAYRSSLSRQLLAQRKRLGLATPKREKFSPKEVTAADIGSNHGYAYLLLLTAERAWAHGMHIKTSHADDRSGKGITGPTRSHIVSRLHKAAKTADKLLFLLREQTSKASERDLLEVRAYHGLLSGSEEFEKQSEGQRPGDVPASEDRWQECLRSFSTARVIYTSLYEQEKKETYRELVANTIDPTIRYAAYQARLSRTIAIPTVAKRYFPRKDLELAGQVEKLDPYALKDKPAPKTDDEKQASPQDVPNSVTWRGRKANIVDASIGQALANVAAAEARLRAYLSSNSAALARDKAAAYDEILIASQDAADATKRATIELEKERVDEGDARMQDLRVTSLAVNYDLVSWRVGRNRILIGEKDGLHFAPQPPNKPKHLRKDGSEYPEKEEARGHKLARLRERVVLYDASVQSINSVKDLRGAMRDARFVEELEGKASYFRALKCLNIAYSHSLLDNRVNALALLQRATSLASQALSSASNEGGGTDGPLNLVLSSRSAKDLSQHVAALLSRTHALVEMHQLEFNSATAAAKNMTSAAPVIQNMLAYPSPGVQVDSKNLVTYPPRIEPVPVKPIILDLAWNFIDYPGRKAEVSMGEKGKDMAMVNGDSHEQQQQKKKGWFGFGGR